MTSENRQGVMRGLVSSRTKSVAVLQPSPATSHAGILIGTDWKITSDVNQVILWHKEGNTKPRWRTEGYVSTIGQALVALVHAGIRETELKNLRAVDDKIEELRCDILKMAAGR